MLISLGKEWICFKPLCGIFLDYLATGTVAFGVLRRGLGSEQWWAVLCHFPLLRVHTMGSTSGRRQGDKEFCPPYSVSAKCPDRSMPGDQILSLSQRPHGTRAKVTPSPISGTSAHRLWLIFNLSSHGLLSQSQTVPAEEACDQGSLSWKRQRAPGWRAGAPPQSQPLSSSADPNGRVMLPWECVSRRMRFWLELD